MEEKKNQKSFWTIVGEILGVCVSILIGGGILYFKLFDTSYYNPLYFSMANPYLVGDSIEDMRKKYTKEEKIHSSCETTLKMLKNPPKVDSSKGSRNMFFPQSKSPSNTMLEMFYNSAGKCVTWLIDKGMENVSEDRFAEYEFISILFIGDFDKIPDEMLPTEEKKYFEEIQTRLKTYKIFPQCQEIVGQKNIDKKLMQQCYKDFIIALYDYKADI